MEAEDANGLGLGGACCTAGLLSEALALRRTGLSVPDKHGASFQRGAAECQRASFFSPWAEFLRPGSRHTRRLLQEYSSLAVLAIFLGLLTLLGGGRIPLDVSALVA